MADKLNGLIFSEFLLDNPKFDPGIDTDGDGNQNKSDEYIELQNTTGQSVSLDGYELWSDAKGLLHAFGSGDAIAPGQTATIVGEYTGSLPDGYHEAGLSEGDDFLVDGEGGKNDSLYLVNTSTGEYISFSYGDPPQPPSPPAGFPGTTQVGLGEALDTNAPNGIAVIRDASGEWTEGAGTPGTPGVPCFVAGTLIRTPDGDRRVEDLRTGDLVLTRSSGPMPILWMGTQTFGPKTLSARPDLRPIALEPRWTGAPARTLVSPQHGVLVAWSGGPEERLARAIQLARLGGGAVRVAEGARSVRYVHFLLPHHEIVYGNGLAMESFYPGPWAVATLVPASRLSLLARFPGRNAGALADAYGSPIVPYARRRDLPRHLRDVSLARVAGPRAADMDVAVDVNAAVDVTMDVALP
ncbi:MAG: Hint domain-containing protein [Pseudomonadota bacterium]